MTISLSSETQQLLEDQMQIGGFSDPDEVVRLALQALRRTDGGDRPEIAPETRRAIRNDLAPAAETRFPRGSPQGLLEAMRGGGLKWEGGAEELDRLLAEVQRMRDEDSQLERGE